LKKNWYLFFVNASVTLLLGGSGELLSKVRLTDLGDVYLPGSHDFMEQAKKLGLIATGSEVPLAVEARQLLAGRGLKARVVSLPSWELFDAQPQAYRDSVLPPSILARVAVEAGVPMGWEKYAGPFGAVVGIENRFGASAPLKVVMEKYGFTAANVAAKAVEVVEGLPARLAALGLKGA